MGPEGFFLKGGFFLGLPFVMFGFIQAVRISYYNDMIRKVGEPCRPVGCGNAYWLGIGIFSLGYLLSLLSSLLSPGARVAPYWYVRYGLTPLGIAFLIWGTIEIIRIESATDRSTRLEVIKYTSDGFLFLMGLIFILFGVFME